MLVQTFFVDFYTHYMLLQQLIKIINRNTNSQIFLKSLFVAFESIIRSLYLEESVAFQGSSSLQCILQY